MGYRGKLAQRERARELRADGWTMPDIAVELGVSRSSVSLWTRDVEFAPRPRRQARAPRPNRLHEARVAEVDELNREGAERLGVLDERAFLVAGAALYAGEGAKGDGAVCFANSDPRMISFFCAWLRRFFDIDESRLRVRLYLHEELDLEAAVTFWSNLTRIPTSQFNKPYRAVADASIRRSKHPMGCPAIVYASRRTHRAVMGVVSALLSSDLTFRGSSIGGAGGC